MSNELKEYEYEKILPLYELKNKQMKKLETVDIKGKAYVTVNARIKYFREHFKGYSMTTELTHINEQGAIIRCSIKNPEGLEVASGIAHEKMGSTFINKTSFIENCETSAWGRALGNFGIGVDDSVASADEVANAIKNQ